VDGTGSPEEVEAALLGVLVGRLPELRAVSEVGA
jgi:hypothetical protein